MITPTLQYQRQSQKKKRKKRDKAEKADIIMTIKKKDTLLLIFQNQKWWHQFFHSILEHLGEW